MTLPLMLLAIGAAPARRSGRLDEWSRLAFLQPVLGLVPEGTAGIATSALVAISLSLAVLGLLVTWFVYASGNIDWLALRVRMQPAQRVLEHGWYVDNYYSALLVTPGKAVAAWIAYVFDTRVIDGAVNGIGASMRAWRAGGGGWQTGLVRTYALAFLAGAIGLLVYVGFRS